jgi:hypothetical protein
MDFITFVQTSRYREIPEGVDRGALQVLCKAMDRAGGIAKLLSNDDPMLESFPVPVIIQLSDAHRDYKAWKESATMLRRSLSARNLTLPDGATARAFNPGELMALDRTAGLCLRSGFADHAGWLAGVTAHIELWRAALKMSIDHGTIGISVKDSTHDDVELYEKFTTSREILRELKAHRWLAIRRGERVGVLELQIELPINGLRRQTATRLEILGQHAVKRGADLTCKELIEGDIATAVLATLDEFAKRQALESMRSAYLSLLATPPLVVDKLLCGHVSSTSTVSGLALLDKKGDVIESWDIAPDDDIASLVATVRETHKPTAAVLSVGRPDNQRLAAMEQAMEGLPLQRVLDLAMTDARRGLSLKSGPASAVVLGRRAIKPGREWGRVSPIALNLGQYTRDIDLEEMAPLLSEAKMVSSWERRQKRSTPRKGPALSAAAVLPTARRLNPMLKTVRDLRPGMTVEGIVTNVTKFGAFVNIGLQIEGMVHVSQLSEEYVDDPTLVVRVGQQVTARVLEIIPEKQRIALTLRPLPGLSMGDRPLGPKPMPGGRPAGDSQSQRPSPAARSGGGNKSRAAALADLNALFNKK